jgi:hypothetical protein
MKKYIRSSEQKPVVQSAPEPIGYGPVLTIDTLKVRKTDYATYQSGRSRRVYEDAVGRGSDGSKLLYYQYANRLHIVYFSDCYLNGPMSMTREYNKRRYSGG